ncbi:hypothetical protein AUC71_06510 [Methyloceanibacter marginalis]|uniref:Uncharacterized protein n=1 Tax=Methyloceanibacter marginalis TaxID=1774971 RepID=A0A1E3WE07_9HYPH|nr:hypothetical protein AUC71_06510 [Methyloceanibacter marginalis]
MAEQRIVGRGGAQLIAHPHGAERQQHRERDADGDSESQHHDQSPQDQSPDHASSFLRPVTQPASASI